MKKLILFLAIVISSVFSSHAAGNSFMAVKAGFLFPSTLNATIGWEKSLKYGNALEIFGEMGNHWQTPVCCQFWKGYYWNGGILYKQRIANFKNSHLRFYGGTLFGAVKTRFSMGVDLGFEYEYILKNGIRLCATQKNNICFFHGDTFRNGILLGVKIPLK